MYLARGELYKWGQGEGELGDLGFEVRVWGFTGVKRGIGLWACHGLIFCVVILKDDHGEVCDAGSARDWGVVTENSCDSERFLSETQISALRLCDCERSCSDPEREIEVLGEILTISELVEMKI